MPIHFRCPSCYALLSIARRKAGQEVTCPKCKEQVIVPTPPDPEDEKTVAVSTDAALLQSPYHPVSEPPRRNIEQSASRPEPAVMVAEPPRSKAQEPLRAVAGPTSARTEHKLGKMAKSEAASEPPLFERSDVIDEILKSATTKAAAEAAENGTRARGLSATPTNAAPQSRSAESLPGVPGSPSIMTEEGLFISRGAAIMLAILVFLLLGLSFAAGFLAGS